MYFNNRQTALENQNTLATAVRKSRTFDEHQATTAMFLMTLVSNFETESSSGWMQNELFGITAPTGRPHLGRLEGIIDTVKRTLEGCGPQTLHGRAFMLVDEELRKDIRFELCPVGSVALFAGVIDSDRWNLRASHTKRIALYGWFVSPEEFVVHDPVLSGALLQGTTRWHGSEYVVGHLRRSGESLKLMNRPLSESYALAEVYHDKPSEAKTLWLYPGMRFELLPEGAPLSRILTAPEDTQPHRAIVPRHGAMEYIRHLLAPSVSTLNTAWAMTDLPQAVNTDGDYPNGGVRGAAVVVCDLLGHNPETPMTRAGLNAALSIRGCRIRKDDSFEGSDGKVYRWNDLMRRNSYQFGRSDSISPSTYGRGGNIVSHHAYLLAVLALVAKYGLPRELFLSTYLELLPNHQSNERNSMLCKLRGLCAVDIDIMAAMEKIGNRSEPEGQTLWDLCAGVFTESRIARSRATYHSDLTASKRKKVLAKFYPTV